MKNKRNVILKTVTIICFLTMLITILMPCVQYVYQFIMYKLS